MADAAYSRRDFAGGAVVTTLNGSINSSDTSITLTTTTGWPSGTNGEFFAVINKGNSTEEKVRIDTRSGSVLTVTASGRGVDGTTAAAHASGESIELCVTAFDLDEANKAVAELVKKATTAGQLLYVSGANAYTALSIGASGRMMVSDGSIPGWVAMSGDATIDSSGALTIANDAVTAAKIATDAVGTAEIAALAVGTAEINDLAVTTAKLDASSVVTAKISDLNVTTAKIADANVTAAKLAEAVRPRWSVGPFLSWVTSFPAALAMGYGIILQDAESVVGPTMTEAGSIVGLGVSCDAARTAGSAVFEVTKNGAGTGLSVTIDGSNTQFHYATQASGTDTFVAGDRLGVTLTSTTITGPVRIAAQIHCQTT